MSVWRQLCLAIRWTALPWRTAIACCWRGKRRPARTESMSLRPRVRRIGRWISTRATRLAGLVFRFCWVRSSRARCLFARPGRVRTWSERIFFRSCRLKVRRVRRVQPIRYRSARSQRCRPAQRRRRRSRERLRRKLLTWGFRRGRTERRGPERSLRSMRRGQMGFRFPAVL